MSVAIVKTDKASGVRKALELLGGMDKFVKKGEKVVVKPNICAGKDSSTGTVTDPEVVAEVCRMVAECGAEPTVAESPIYPYKSARVYSKSGYSDFESRYGFPFVDIDSTPYRDVRVPGGKAIDHILVSDVVLMSDRLINVPVIKTHLQTTVTLGLKNLKGVVPGKQKHLIHLTDLHKGIVDLNTVVKTDLTVIDGIVGMEGTGGPTNGRAVRMDVIVAGDNVVETDAVGVRLMGGDPKAVEHLRLAAERGLGSLDGFEIVGDSLESASKNLDLPKRPELNRLLITGIGLRVMDFVRKPIMKLTGGESVERSARIGELIIDEGACDGCRLCLASCPVEALSYGEALLCDRETCIECFCCAEVCPAGALSKKF